MGAGLRWVVVIGHLGLNVDDLERARAHWAVLMPLLDFEPFLDSPDEFAYRPADGKPGTYLFFYASQDRAAAGYSRHRSGLQHLAFMVPTRARVHELAAQAEALGCELDAPPQEYSQYHPGYFGVFWEDQEGFMIEVVNHRDQESTDRS